jgi:hypothetical protein
MAGRRWSLLLIGIFLAVGVGFGALWAAIAPTDVLQAGDGGLFLVEPQPEAEFGAQAIFLGLGLLIGVGAGVQVWRTHRDQPVIAALLLAAGGLLCALLAAEVGIALGPAAIDATAVPNGETVAAPLRIEAGGVLFAVAIGAVGAFLVGLLLTEEPEPASVAGTEPQDQRAIAETEADVTDTRSAGDSPMSSPRFPPET